MEHVLSGDIFPCELTKGSCVVSYRFDHRPVYARFPLGKACRNKVGTSHRTKHGWTPRLHGRGQFDIVSSNFESLSATFSLFVFAKCWKFLGGRSAPTQSCLRSCSQRSAGCWHPRTLSRPKRSEEKKNPETFCLESIGSCQFGFVKPCCVQTIQHFRKYALVRAQEGCLVGMRTQTSDLESMQIYRNLDCLCLQKNSVVPNTAQCFKFRLCSANASTLIQRQPLWIVSLDLSKAFDRVHWGSLWQALRQHEVSDHMVWILQMPLPRSSWYSAGFFWYKSSL